MDEKSALLDQAARCRRAAQTIGEHKAATRLVEQAKEYEERAASLASASSIQAGSNILVRRDQFNITPHGIIHKPTDAAFTPHPGDPHSGEMRNGRLGNALPNMASYNPEEVWRMMRELWTEYVARNI